MKKTKYLLVIVSVLVLLLTFVATVSAEETEKKSGVFTYAVTDGKVTITDCDILVEGHIVIPESIDGYPVTAIAEKAFYDCNKITDVTIPESIKSISDFAFAFELENVYVESMDFWYYITFEGMNANPMHQSEKFYVDNELLSELVIPEGITVLPDYAFYGCDSLTSVILPKSLQVLGEWSFSSCENLRGVYADSVEYWINLHENTYATGKSLHLSYPIGKYTKLYVGGELLVDLVIPDSVTRLLPYIFSGLDTIKSVTFHKDFVSIESNTFSGCYGLKEVYVPDLKVWFKICSDINRLFGGGKTIETLYINGEPVEDLVVPEDIDTMVQDAFLNYKKLKSITITSPIKKFESTWAYGCDNFKAIYVDSFETWNACEPEGVPNSTLGMIDCLYIDGEPVVDLVIPEGTTSIRDYAFFGYKALKSVSIPKSVRKIGLYALNFSLESVYVESLEDWLSLCDEMAGIKNSMWHPMEYAENFYVDGELITNIVIPEGTTKIPGLAFYNIKSAESITFKSVVTEIKDKAFLGCSEIKSVYVPDIDLWFRIPHLKELFKNLPLKNLYIAGELLTEYTVPDGVTSLPEYAFAYYAGIKSVIFPSSLKSIGNNAFVGCDNIESVYAPSLEYWMSIDFASGDSNPLCGKSKLYLDGEILENLRVPESISKVKQHAFSGYYGLKAFYITGKPLVIGYNAFDSACKQMKIYAETLEDWFSVSVDSSLFPASCNPMRCGATLYIGGEELPEEIVIPESVKVIPSYAFQNCKNLKKITLPATTKIGENVFRDSGLKEVIIGSLTEKAEPVRDITFATFQNCKTIEKITFGYGVKSIGRNAFKEWSNLKEVILYSGIEEICEKAFYKTGIASVTIPSTVKNIGLAAFAYCKSLNDITFGDTVDGEAVTKIENEAFSNCEKLKTVTFNSGVKEIGEKVFYNTIKIEDIYINDLTAYLGIGFPDFSVAQDSNPTHHADNMYINGEVVKNLVIPEGVTRICHYAFSGCKTLETVKFPSTLVEIGEHSFENCTELKDFSLPESVEIIGEFGFLHCKSITTLELKKNVKDVGREAFTSCIGLETIYMYPELLKIGEEAFYGCENIGIILYSGTKVAWDKLLSQNKKSGLETFAVYFRFRPESMYAPETIEAVQTADSITLVWSEVNGVTGYRVYVKDSSEWKTLKTLKENTCKITGLKSSTKYSFAVKAYISTGAFVLWSPEYITIDTETKVLKPSEITTAPKEHMYDNSCDTTCNECGAKRTIKHTYTNACDTSCNVCKTTRKITHSYSNACDKTCNICGVTRTLSAHKYTNSCDTTCNECGAKRTIEHTYANACDTSCNVCKATRKITHSYSNVCDKTCNICRVTRTPSAHKYTNSCDTTCNECGAKRTIKHTYTNACDTSCNVCKATRKITHTYKKTTTKATLAKNGKFVTKCTVCGDVSETTTIYYPKTIKLSATKYTYNGKAKKPSVTVKDSKGNVLKKNTDYTIKYASGRKNTGKYTVTVTFKGKYTGTKKLTFNILPSKTSKITPACDTTSIKASWKKVTGADGYKVELLNSKGKAVKTATTTKTAYTFKKLSKVTTYKVRVTAYKTIDKKKVYATVSTTITTSTAPAKVTLSKVTVGKKQATPAWKTVKSASGYEVQYSTSSKFKSTKTATVKKGSTKKTTIKKLTKGKKYYFKVRAYKTVDGKKVYGAWSSVKSVKVK